ncbi:hypothetical protein ACFDTO_32445 [Microbacteriaceae bacterium 4G12]
MRSVFALLLILISILTACSVTTSEAKWARFHTYLPEGTIELRDGKTGKTVTITEEEKVKELLPLFSELHLAKIPNKEIKGYPYLMNIGTNRILLFDNMIKINDQYYETDKEVPLEKIKMYFN